MQSEYKYMQSETANRERQPELREIHYEFQEQGKRLTDCLERLSTIGNKLADESGNLSMAEKKQEPLLTIKLPGITTDLSNCVEGFKGVISCIQNQLSKIEKHI